MTKIESPLVTFCLIAYNQEQFIKEAIEGAFSQTYTRLEIVLSDDHSPDNTFAIMKKMAAEYKGPHKVVLNSNEVNKGIGGHINAVMKVAKGDFIVIAAGDDISLPKRTDMMVSAWLSSGKKLKSIFSGNYEMDLFGTTVCESNNGHLLNNLANAATLLSNNGYFIGATHGWDRDVFEKFGDINPKVIHEDRTLPFRSLLLGSVGYISEPLVKYREGGISSSYSHKDIDDLLYGKMHEVRKRYLDDYEQRYVDL